MLDFVGYRWWWLRRGSEPTGLLRWRLRSGTLAAWYSTVRDEGRVPLRNLAPAWVLRHFLTPLGFFLVATSPTGPQSEDFGRVSAVQPNVIADRGSVEQVFSWQKVSRRTNC